uniref:Uncharacterized protein n=1 Tax=Anguilla anguilla TaxID=7936 RepID=A0A0E9QIL0_ANGAN
MDQFINIRLCDRLTWSKKTYPHCSANNFTQNTARLAKNITLYNLI